MAPPPEEEVVEPAPRVDKPPPVVRDPDDARHTKNRREEFLRGFDYGACGEPFSNPRKHSSPAFKLGHKAASDARAKALEGYDAIGKFADVQAAADAI